MALALLHVTLYLAWQNAKILHEVGVSRANLYRLKGIDLHDQIKTHLGGIRVILS